MITPYEMLIRFHTEQSTIGITLSNLVSSDGYSMITDPQHVDGNISDPRVQELATLFNAQTVAQLAAMKQERDEAVTAAEQIPALLQMIQDLRNFIDPPNAIWPNAFQALLTSDQKIALWSSLDKEIVEFKSSFFTLNGAIPFTDGEPLWLAVLQLGQWNPELFPPDEITRILERQPPQA